MPERLIFLVQFSFGLFRVIVFRLRNEITHYCVSFI